MKAAIKCLVSFLFLVCAYNIFGQATYSCPEPANVPSWSGNLVSTGGTGYALSSQGEVVPGHPLTFWGMVAGGGFITCGYYSDAYVINNQGQKVQVKGQMMTAKQAALNNCVINNDPSINNCHSADPSGCVAKCSK